MRERLKSFLLGLEDRSMTKGMWTRFLKKQEAWVLREGGEISALTMVLMDSPKGFEKSF